MKRPWAKRADPVLVMRPEVMPHSAVSITCPWCQRIVIVRVYSTMAPPGSDVTAVITSRVDPHICPVPTPQLFDWAAEEAA